MWGLLQLIVCSSVFVCLSLRREPLRGEVRLVSGKGERSCPSGEGLGRRLLPPPHPRPPAAPRLVPLGNSRLCLFQNQSSNCPQRPLSSCQAKYWVSIGELLPSLALSARKGWGTCWGWRYQLCSPLSDTTSAPSCLPTPACLIRFPRLPSCSPLRFHTVPSPESPCFQVSPASAVH